MLEYCNYSGTVAVAAASADEALSDLAGVLSNPKHPAVRTVERRGGRVRELAGMCVVVLGDPTRRLCLAPARKLNPWTSMAEFPWLMAGRNDVAWLRPYLPRAADFSDDGSTWRAGYGPRLRTWRGGTRGPGFDQLRRVVEMLARNPLDRRAVISLWDPLADLAARDWQDLNQEWRDYPCTNWMHFQVNANGALDLTVVMRSNDVVWGFSGVNLINFTLLQQLVAELLGRPLGHYRHVTDNMHAYERHWPMLEALTEAAKSPRPDDELNRGSMPLWRPVTGHGAVKGLERWTERAGEALYRVERRRREAALAGAVDWNGTVWSSRADWPFDSDAPWLGEWAHFMLMHPAASRGEGTAGQWTDALAGLYDARLAFAAAAWLVRNHPTVRALPDVAVSRARRPAKAGEWLKALLRSNPEHEEEHVTAAR